MRKGIYFLNENTNKETKIIKRNKKEILELKRTEFNIRHKTTDLGSSENTKQDRYQNKQTDKQKTLQLG